jgi:5-methylcytosine-specific restriction endonuclease McrA
MAKPRDYAKEYREYHGKPSQIRNRAQRNAARRLAIKDGKARKGDGKEVDHVRPISKGGTNHRKNLRVVSRRENRTKGDR